MNLLASRSEGLHLSLLKRAQQYTGNKTMYRQSLLLRRPTTARRFPYQQPNQLDGNLRLNSSRRHSAHGRSATQNRLSCRLTRPMPAPRTTQFLVDDPMSMLLLSRHLPLTLPTRQVRSHL